MIAIVVASPGAASLVGRGSGGGGAMPPAPNSEPVSKGAAQNWPVRGWHAVPTALTATSAPTVLPSGKIADADPIPPLSPGNRGTRSGAVAAKGEFWRGVVQGGAAKLRIGAFRPVLFAVGEIEQNGGRDDGHPCGSGGKAATLRPQARHDPLGSAKAKGRTAGQGEGIDLVDKVLGRKQVGFACSGGRRP